MWQSPLDPSSKRHVPSSVLVRVWRRQCSINGLGWGARTPASRKLRPLEAPKFESQSKPGVRKWSTQNHASRIKKAGLPQLFLALKKIGKRPQKPGSEGTADLTEGGGCPFFLELVCPLFWSFYRETRFLSFFLGGGSPKKKRHPFASQNDGRTRTQSTHIILSLQQTKLPQPQFASSHCAQTYAIACTSEGRRISAFGLRLSPSDIHQGRPCDRMGARTRVSKPRVCIWPRKTSALRPQRCSVTKMRVSAETCMKRTGMVLPWKSAVKGIAEATHSKAASALAPYFTFCFLILHSHSPLPFSLSLSHSLSLSLSFSHKTPLCRSVKCQNIGGVSPKPFHKLDQPRCRRHKQHPNLQQDHLTSNARRALACGKRYPRFNIPTRGKAYNF